MNVHSDETEWLKKAMSILKDDGILLCPTDTIWGLSVLPSSGEAIKKLRALKGREVSKPFIVIVPNKEVLQKITGPLSDSVLVVACSHENPTSIVYSVDPQMKSHFPVADDGTLCIRVVSTGFCGRLMEALNSGLVSTSANYSGNPGPRTFDEIDEKIVNLADGVIPGHLAGEMKQKPSRILQWLENGEWLVIRD